MPIDKLFPAFLRPLLTLLGGSLLHAQSFAQLEVNTTFTPSELVNNILVGQGITVSNLTFNGTPGNTVNDQIGAFYSASSNIGVSDGIVLSTGRVEGVSGSNMNPSLTLPPSNPVSTPDPDLAMIESMLNNVAVLEFDFIPTGDSVNFRFVFGSEEYPEYVCSQYNDVFGFFLSGPGLAGPFSNGAINLGVLPDTNTPIAINTVNAGTPGVLSGGASGCAASDPNWQANAIYYIDNQGGTTVELDGFTVPIRTGAAVQCGATYHIKIAIAHAGDGSLDSAVLIEGGSFTSANQIDVTITTPQNDGTLTEGCGEAVIGIAVPQRSADANIQLEYRGASLTAEELAGHVATVTIPAGAGSANIPISAESDGAEEGSEVIWIIATWVADCGSSAKDSVQVTLLDHSPMAITAIDQYLGCDRDTVQLTTSVTGGLGEVSITWSNGHTGPQTSVTGLEDMTYTITATDECPSTVTADVSVFSGCEIDVPNVITPNSDGHNDAWVIEGLPRSKHSVTVFNRWGQVIFESSHYANNWRAVGVPDGTYFYEILSDRADGPLTGTLTILGNGR